MTALISKALSSGFTQKQIMDYILKKFPQHAAKINAAQASGFTVKQILGLISGDKSWKRKSEMDSAYNEEPMTEYAQTRNKDEANTQGRTNKAIQGAALVGGSLAAPMAAKALQHALPNNLSGISAPLTTAIQNQTPPLQPPQSPNSPQPQARLQSIQQQAPLTPTPQQAQQSSPLQPPSDNSLQTNLAQNANLQQPKGISNDIIFDIISKHPQKSQIDALAKSGNGPEEIEAFYQKFNPKVIKEIEKESGRPFIETMTEYLAKRAEIPKDNAQNPQIQPESAISAPQNDKISPVTQEIEPIKIEKKSFVKTPKGVGEIKELRNGEALVEVDNKLHKFKEDELEGSQFTEDDIADAYDRLMELTPEVAKSSFVSWAGYDEDKNELGFIPRGGKYEVLKDITPEEAEAIKTKSVAARTSGETREGLWIIGETTGAGLISQIIHDRKRKAKESEEKQGKFDLGEMKPEKHDRGMKPIFGETDFARGLSKDRERKAKEEERRKKKEEKERLKNEEKARKKRKL